MSLAPPVAELLSTHSLKVRDLGAALLLVTIDVLNFMEVQGLDLDHLMQTCEARHPCERALALLVRVRRFVRTGDTSWAEVREHLEQLDRRQFAN